ncbi:MAG: hypothetical protein ACKN9V_08180 [Pseudomonadota bacterium]
MKLTRIISILFLSLVATLAFGADFKNPFNPEEVSFSSENLKTVRFLKSTKVEIELAGKIKRDYEIYLDGRQIPIRQNQFKTSVNIFPTQNSYEFKIKRPGISETIYPFKIKFLKEVPLPLRVRIETNQTKPIAKEKVFTGSFPAEEWIEVSWMDSTEKMDPIYVAKIERERQERIRLEEERLERERIERERLEEEKRELARLEQERLERARAEEERMKKMQDEMARLEQERLEKVKEEQERVRKVQEEMARVLAKQEEERKLELQKKMARLEEERIEKERREQERLDERRKEQARLERERLEKEKEEQDRMLEMQKKMARLEEEKREEEKREKERMERERLDERRKEQARLERERLEKEKEEQERVLEMQQKAARFEEEKREKERDLASQLERENQLIQQPQYKAPGGLSINQGLSSLSLKQSAVDLSSLNWMLNLAYQKSLSDKLSLTTVGQGYLVPLSVTGASKAPNLVKAGASLGYILKDPSGTEWTPYAGFGYQTMMTSESIGYRNLFGPRLGISLKLPVGPLQVLNSSLALGLFPTPDQILGFGNNEIHFKLAYQWKVASSFISSLSLGVDFSSLNLTISGAKLTSSGYSIFFGLDL